MPRSRAFASNVIAVADTIGVPLPKAVAAAIAEADALIAAAEKISASPHQLTAVALTALAAGTDYHSDANVAKLAIDHLLGVAGVGAAARDRADHDITAVLVEHADSILTSWADKLDQHSAGLAAAAAALNDLDAAAAAQGGQASLQHWANAQSALAAWTAARQGLQSLGLVSGVPVSNEPLAIVDTTDQFAEYTAAIEAAQRQGVPVSPWVLARAGLVLRLPTVSDYMQRVAGLAQQQEQAATEAEEQQEKRRAAFA